MLRNTLISEEIKELIDQVEKINPVQNEGDSFTFYEKPIDLATIERQFVHIVYDYDKNLPLIDEIKALIIKQMQGEGSYSSYISNLSRLKELLQFFKTYLRVHD